MLGGMQELEQDCAKDLGQEPAKDFAGSFASVLSALRAARGARDERQGAGWSDERLAEDVVELSYEKALRSHARYNPNAFRTDAPGAEEEAKPRKRARAAKGESRRRETVPEESRKTSSVTIRMSRAEWELLQARATEAKMSLSAYMRSCTLEVEELRAQVKETLAELKQARQNEAEREPAKKPVEIEAASGWRARLFPRWTLGRAAEA